MDNLKNVTKLVKSILEEDAKARNSDDYLYYKVISKYSCALGDDVFRISVAEFMIRRSELGFPGFETVKRTRQKVQQHHPELCASEEVEENRQLNELRFEEYARSSVV